MGVQSLYILNKAGGLIYQVRSFLIPIILFHYILLTFYLCRKTSSPV